MARLRADSGYVYVHKDDGASHEIFGPGDEIPEWAVEHIRNPHVWDKDDAPVEEPPHSPGGVPRRSGPGATREAWVFYAQANGVDVPEDWNRENIIIACEKAGLPV